MSATQIPGERLAPIARRTASNAKTIAAVLLFLCGLFLIAGVALIAGGESARGHGTQGDPATTAAGMVIWIVVLGAIARAFLRRARRATEVASLAVGQKGHTFTLDGKTIFTADMVGVVNGQLTFKVSAFSRAELLEIPTATVVR